MGRMGRINGMGVMGRHGIHRLLAPRPNANSEVLACLEDPTRSLETTSLAT